MQGSSHEGRVLSIVLLLNLHAFISVKHLVGQGGCHASAYGALLCLLVLRLCKCLFVQHESGWRQVPFCSREHKL